MTIKALAAADPGGAGAKPAADSPAGKAQALLDRQAAKDKAAQEKLFGSVTVKDEELAMFCMAWSMSNDTARKQAMEMMQKAKSVKADSGEHVMRFLLEPSGESAK